MTVTSVHKKWRNTLLESCEKGVVYRLKGKNEGPDDLLFMMTDGDWEIMLGDTNTVNRFRDVDLAAEHLITLGVEEYDSPLEMIHL